MSAGIGNDQQTTSLGPDGCVATAIAFLNYLLCTLFRDAEQSRRVLELVAEH
jgi:hypothetical protein